MKTVYEKEAKLDKEKAWNNGKWKPIVNYNTLAEFSSDVRDIIDGDFPNKFLAELFADAYARKKLEKNLAAIEDAYRLKAKKGRASTTLQIVWTPFRAYVILRTDPNHEVIVWGWWKTADFQRRYDIQNTFA